MLDAIQSKGFAGASDEGRVGLLPIIAGAFVALIVAGLLWWRFGDSVFTTSMVSAFMACF